MCLLRLFIYLLKNKARKNACNFAGLFHCIESVPAEYVMCIRVSPLAQPSRIQVELQVNNAISK